jgi:very-short-patch-repair endonuclease/predicted transcriptional regulator of viral defense system
MRPKRLELATERALATIAARQHGVLTGAQLAAAGVGQRGVSRRVADGRLHRLHRGVFLLGPLTGRWTREMAAVLACGATAVLSHRSAAVLWGFYRAWHGLPEVTVPEGGSRGRPGLRVYRTSRLDPRETRRREGVPVTSPARTLLDLATVVTERDLARAVEEAQVLRLVTPRELAHIAGRGRPGSAALRAVLNLQHEPSLTRSEAEIAFLELVRDAGLPAPETNVNVLGHEVDFLWRAQKLIVEVDGFAYHSSRQAFERDRRRDARLQAAGFRVVRFTYLQVVNEPHTITACLDTYITKT